MVEVMNKFKGLDPVHRVPEEVWTEEPGGLQFIGLQRVRYDGSE